MIIQIVEKFPTYYSEACNVLVAKTFDDVKQWAEKRAISRSPRDKVDLSEIREIKGSPGFYAGEFKIGSTRFYLNTINAQGWD